MNELKLKQVCMKCGVSRRAIQGYEKHGLVHATGKTERGYLLYDNQAQTTVLLLKSLQDYGFSLKEIVVYQNSNDTSKLSMLEEKLVVLIERQQKITSDIEKLSIIINNIKEN